MVKVPWSIKYRPAFLDDYIFQNDSQRQVIAKYIADASIPNLMLTGHRGTGKTTLALVIKNELEIEDTDFLKINASDENSVDTIRTKIKSFVGSIATGPFKLVLLDECDHISLAGQAVLRGMLEDPHIMANARFILTGNYVKRILPELRSRCQEFKFDKIDKDAMLEKAAIVLGLENINIPSLELLEEFVNAGYPDMRKVLQLLEQYSVNGVLQSFHPIDTSSSELMAVLPLVAEGNWFAARNIVCGSVEGDGWIEVYRFLYDYIHEVGKFTEDENWRKAIVIIADHLYKHATVADPEINLTACLIKLTEI